MLRPIYPSKSSSALSSQRAVFRTEMPVCKLWVTRACCVRPYSERACFSKSSARSSKRPLFVSSLKSGFYSRLSLGYATKPIAEITVSIYSLSLVCTSAPTSLSSYALCIYFSRFFLAYKMAPTASLWSSLMNSWILSLNSSGLRILPSFDLFVLHQARAKLQSCSLLKLFLIL